MPGNVIISHKLTINSNHMTYDSWDMKCNRQNVLSFWAIFCHFTSITAQKIKMKKKRKTTSEDIIILLKCTGNHDHMLYCYCDVVRNRCNCYFSFWAFFLPFYLPNIPKKTKFQKNEKNARRYNHFTHVYQKSWLDDVPFLRHGVQQTDKKMMYRGGCPT